jgi:hypothetical protein
VRNSPALLLAYRRYPARREPGGPRADQIGEASDQFQLRLLRRNVQRLLEEAERFVQGFVRVSVEVSVCSECSGWLTLRWR